MSGTLVCFVSLGQSQPYAKCPYVWYTCVLSLLDRAGPFAKCPYVWYTGLLCLSWTEPAVMPSVLMSGTLVCYVSLGQSQTLMPNGRRRRKRRSPKRRNPTKKNWKSKAVLVLVGFGCVMKSMFVAYVPSRVVSLLLCFFHANIDWNSKQWCRVISLSLCAGMVPLCELSF